MQIHKTTEKIRIEVLTDQETSVKILKSVMEEPFDALDGGMRKEKAKAELARLAGTPDPDKRLTFILSPLSAKQKSEVMSYVSTDSGKMVQSTYEMGLAAIRFSLKGIEGLFDGDKPYEIPLKDGIVTDEGLDVILNLPVGKVLMETSRKLAGSSGIPKQIIDDRTGAPMPNVEVIISPKA